MVCFGDSRRSSLAVLSYEMYQLEPSLESRRDYLELRLGISLQIGPLKVFRHLLLHDRPTPVLQIWQTYPDVSACASYDVGSIHALPWPFLPAFTEPLQRNRVAMSCTRLNLLSHTRLGFVDNRGTSVERRRQVTIVISVRYVHKIRSVGRDARRRSCD